MKKLVIMLISVSLILLGCVGKETPIKNDNITNVDSGIKDNMDTKNIVNTDTDFNANTANGQAYKMSDSISNSTHISENDVPDTGSNIVVSNSASNNDWCVPGNKITVRGEEFTIVGITTYKDRNVCKAEIIRNNGKTTRYYSEDGSFESMISTSSGSGANSKAVSVVSVNNS